VTATLSRVAEAAAPATAPCVAGVRGAAVAATVALALPGGPAVVPAAAAMTALCVVAVPLGAVTLAGAGSSLAVSVPSATSVAGAPPLVISLEHLVSL
jgi:hypothetical protein